MTYARFTALVLMAAGLLALVGILPTQRLVGAGSWAAVVAGCAASALASLVGSLPAVLWRSPGRSPIVVAFAAMALRLAVILGLGLTLLLSNGFPRGPLLLWIGISYVVLLPLDTRFVLRTAMEFAAESGLEKT